MPNKAYAILLNLIDEDSGYIYFPIKRENQPFGGMPQFFGGTKEGSESDRDTINRELKEESDGKLSLKPGKLNLVYKGNIGNNIYNFYVTENYSGSNFLGPLKNPEMSSIENFFVQIDEEDNVDDLLRRLKIIPTEEFVRSETYMAFDKAIKWSEED